MSLPPHQNIVRVFDSDILRSAKGASEAYIVMEYCPGSFYQPRIHTRMLSTLETHFISLSSLSVGGSLIDLLNQRIASRLNESEILAIFEQICEAVAHLHSQDPPIIHRGHYSPLSNFFLPCLLRLSFSCTENYYTDLKIENVIIGADRMYKLCDFGSAIKGPIFPFTERERSRIAEDIDR
jgi:serine/threonine protein kinase